MDVFLLLLLMGILAVVLVIIIVKLFLQPKKIDSLVRYYISGNYKRLYRAATRIIIRNPYDSTAHYYLGLYHIAKESPNLALMELETVNKLGQFNKYIDENSFRQNIAKLYVQFNYHEEALKEYLLLLKDDVANPSYHYTVGTLFEKRNNIHNALRHYKLAIDLDPHHANSHARIGSLLYRAKHFNEAQTYLAEATKLDPDNTLGSFILGKIFKNNKHYTAAIKAFEAASMEPKLRSQSLLERGLCYIQLGDLEDAEPDLLRAIKTGSDATAPEILRARYHLANILEKKRNLDGAMVQWEAISAVNENYGDVAMKLADYQALRNDDAIKDFLTISATPFIELCKKVIAKAGLFPIHATTITNGCQIIAVEGSVKSVRDNRTPPKLVHFMRLSAQLDEEFVRSFNTSMREMSCVSGMIFTSSSFSSEARHFVENRSILLRGRDYLQKLLWKIEPK